MAVDTALWLILAAIIAFVGCGCLCTARDKKPAPAQRPEERFDYQVDRAA